MELSTLMLTVKAMSKNYFLLILAIKEKISSILEIPYTTDQSAPRSYVVNTTQPHAYMTHALQNRRISPIKDLW